MLSEPRLGTETGRERKGLIDVVINLNTHSTEEPRIISLRSLREQFLLKIIDGNTSHKRPHQVSSIYYSALCSRVAH